MTFLQFNELFPTEDEVIRYFINIRYDEVICPHCKSHKVYRRHDQPKVFTCKNCNNSFSIFKGTILEKTSTDLRKWFYSINLFMNAKKGVSACQLQREVGVTYKTAWRILKQIRMAMGNEHIRKFVNTIIEMDKTYVGGKPRKSGMNKRGRGTNKTPVIGAVDRNNKQIHCRVALPNEESKALSSKQLLSVLENVCKRQNIVITDEFRGYNILEYTQHFHYVINHSAGEYSDKNGVHTNNIEGFWATLKRGIIGIYHHISVKYLQNYVNEFCFRYNNRNRNMFDITLKQSVLV